VLKELEAFDDAAAVAVEAGDDALGEHGEGILCGAGVKCSRGCHIGRLAVDSEANERRE
jgi:hypothetical protein